jgi:hypothetical protein
MRIISVRQGFTADHSSTSYEFLAVDKPLSKEAKKKVAALSSRANPTSRRVHFVYNVDGYDIPGGWRPLMEEHYDVMYSESYDWWLLVMALNISKARREELLRYQFSNYDDLGIDISGGGERVIVTISCRLDSGAITGGYYDEADDWDEEDETKEESIGAYESDDQLLNLLVKIRKQLIDGDYRSLYAVWEVYGEEDDIEEKPPMPPDKLSGRNIVAVFRDMLTE